jgi:hypothetical protein
MYVNEAAGTEEWHTLVHVCRRWRNVVFSSPRRLDLRLLCTTRRPVRARLDVWPALPITLVGSVDPTLPVESADNILAALEHRDRVCHISLQHIPNSLVGRLAAAMYVPFEELTYLELRSNNDDESAPGLPDSFLGGSAPRLQRLRLACIPFPALPKLLLSACQLVNLELVNIPHSGYISPQIMVTCLSALTRLDTLRLEFRSPLSRPDRRTTPSPSRLTRVLLPALSMLYFKGVSEYFEDVVAQIDAPLLNQIWIEYFHQLLFDTPQLLQFISRTNELKTSDRADILFRGDCVRIILYSQRGTVERRILGLTILCGVSEWQLSSLAQLCGVFLPRFSTLERLDIREDTLRPYWRDDMENVQWLELLQPFTAVKDLYLSKGLEPRVRPVLQELAADLEGLTGVLPALKRVVIGAPQLSGSAQAVIHGEVPRRGTLGSPHSYPPSIKTRFGIEPRQWSEVYD